MTIGDRIQLYAGAVTNTTTLQQFVDEATRLVYDELPEQALIAVTSEEADSGSGVDVTNKRIITVHKSGYEARHLESVIRSRLTEEDNTYEAESWRPAWYVLGTTAYVIPDGGTIATVAYPTVAYDDATVTGVPTGILDLIVLRASELAVNYLMQEERDALDNSVTLPTAPTAPLAPVISYTDAAAVAPSATTIATLPSAPTYSDPTLPSAPSTPTVGTLDLTKKTDGLTALTAPTAPSAPTIAYADATAATVSATTIAALPAVPSYGSPSFGGNLSLPSLPSLDLTTEINGTTSLDPPTAPSAPAIAYVDAVAATASATSIAALGTAPTYTKPSFGGSLSLPSLPSDLDLTKELDGITALNPPTAPSAPAIAYSDASAAAVTATAIGALPTPPTFSAVSFGGSLGAPSISAINLTKEVDGVTALNPPSVPAAPSIAYSDATAATVSATTVGTIPAAPTYSAPTFGGTLTLPSLPTLDLTDEIDGLTALDPPAVPSAPSLAAVDAAAVAAAASAVAALSTAPTYTKPTFGGSLTIPTLTSISFTNNVKGAILNRPSAPSAPSIGYTDASLGTFTAAATVGGLPTPPSLSAASFAGTISSITSAVPAALDLSTKIDNLTQTIPPTAPTPPNLSSAGQGTTTVDFATTVNGLAPTFTAAAPALDFTDWDTYFDGSEGEDPEIMAGVLNKIRTELDQESLQHQDNRATWENAVEIYRQNIQKAITDAQLAAQEAANEMRATDEMLLQDYVQELNAYDREMAEYKAVMQTQIDEHQANLARAIQGLAEAQRLYLDEYRMLVQESVAQFQGDVQDHMREADRVIEQARLDQQRLSEMFRSQTDMNIQNEIQTLQAAVADWESAWQLYQAEIQQYQLDVEHVVRKWEIDYQEAIAPWVEAQALHLQNYSLDIQNELNEFNKELAAYRQDAEVKIEEARITLQEALLDAQNSTEVALRNKAQKLAGEIRDWEASVEIFQTGLSRYEAEVNRQVTTFQLDYQKAFEPWAHQQTLYIQEYANDIQSARDALSAQAQKHQADVQKVIEQAAADLQSNLEQARLTTDVAVQNEVQTMNGLIQDYIYTLQQHQQDMAVYDAEVGRVVEDWKADFQKAMEPYVQEQQMHLQKYTQDLQQESDSVRVDLEDFNRESDRLIQQAQVTLQEALTAARLSTDVSVANEQATLQAAIADWQGDIEQYNAARATYTDELSRQLDEFDRNLAKATALWAEQQRLYVDQYSLDIQSERNEFESALVEYQQDAQRKIQQAQITLQEAIANANASSDVSVRNEAATLEAAVRDWQADVEVFQTGLARYQAEVQRQLDDFDRDYQKAYEPWAQQQALYLKEYEADIRVASDTFAGAMQDHMREADRIIQQAQITAQEALQQAQLTTSTAVQNEAQTLAAAVQDYELELALYRDKTRLYQTEVEAVVQQYVQDLDRSIRLYEAEGALDVQRHQVKAQDARADFEAALAVYRATLERNNLTAEIAQREAQQTAAQATEVAVVNKAKQLEADIADYRLTLELHQEEVRSYQAQVEAALSEKQILSRTTQEKTRMMHFDRERVRQMYQERRISYMRMVWPKYSYTVRQPVI